MFEWLKITPPETLTDIQRAARFYYLQQMAFGGKVSNQTFGTATTDPPRLNLLRMEEDLSQAHLRLSRCYIEHLNWIKCIDKYDRPQTLFFCDPPYWQTEGYGVGFDFEQYELLASKMRTIKGKIILTINDHPDMRKVFGEFKIETVKIKYTVGGNSRGKEAQEMIAMNW
jgi:DNA adenine methylase